VGASLLAMNVNDDALGRFVSKLASTGLRVFFG
jgi:hypothetical protein